MVVCVLRPYGVGGGLSMRQEARAAVLAFLRVPTKEAFATAETFEDEIATFFSTLDTSGTELDDELLLAFDECLIRTPPNEEIDMLVERFFSRFCGIPTNDSNEVTELTDADIEVVPRLASPPPVPSTRSRTLH